MSSVSKSRVRIFDYWQIQEPSLEAEPPVRRSNEPLFGEDAIGEAQRLIANITGFLQSRRNYQQKAGVFRAQVDDLLGTLYQACNSEAEEEGPAEANLKLYKANLRKLYTCLRNGKLLENRITTYFQAANLANYDPNLTQLAFSDPPERMRKRLDEGLAGLQRAMHQVMQGQKLLESGKELSSIFGKEHAPKTCLQRLEDELRHENLVKVHFLMIYQLEELDKELKQLREFINVAEREYLKYELVLDCLFLMRGQSAEMQEQLAEAQNELQDACLKPAEADVRVLGASSEQRAENWAHNNRIYQANLSNFTRVNVETNMVYYSELKARFVEQLDLFGMASHRQQTSSKSLLFLLDRYGLMADIKRRLLLVPRISEPDRRLALSIYNETSAHAVPRDNPALQGLKEGLLGEMEVLLVNNDIAYNKRARERVVLEQDILRHQSILQQLEATPPREQYAFLTDRLSDINAAAFELEELEADRQRFLTRKRGQTEEGFRSRVNAVGSYRLALQYAGAVGRKGKIEQFEAINAKEGFSDLPLKFQATLFNYIHDTAILEDSRTQGLFQRAVERVAEGLRDSLTKSRLRGSIDSQLEKEFDHLQQAWFDLHHRYFRRVSHFGQELLLDRLLQLSGETAAYVRTAVGSEYPLVNPKTMDIDRKSFFTHRVLSELVTLSNNPARESFKIANVVPTIQEVFRSLDRDFISKSAGGKLADIVKLGLLEQYLKQVYGCKNLWRAVRTLRWAAYLQSVSELYPASPLSRQAVLQALLRLQLQLNAVAATFKVNDELKTTLTEALPPLLKEMRRFPLSLAARHDVSGFVAVWRFDEIIEELRLTLKQRLSIDNVAIIFVGINELKDARKASEGSYEAYENAVVKEKKALEEYFAPERTTFQPKIDAISREIQLATKNFLNRDESVSLARAIEALCKKAQAA